MSEKGFENVERRMICAVDFDKTLEVNGSLNHVVAKYMRRRFDEGAFIVIYTARPWEDRALVEAFALQNNVIFDVVVCGKLRYDEMICDKTRRPEELDDDCKKRDEGRSAIDSEL